MEGVAQTRSPAVRQRSFLTQVLAWEIQARAYGGLKTSVHRQLLALGSHRTNTECKIK
jgi:hypothetical protein